MKPLQTPKQVRIGHPDKLKMYLNIRPWLAGRLEA
ncbi:hypothetical protein CEXT_307891, partial [Caerostris extrusa]